MCNNEYSELYTTHNKRIQKVFLFIWTTKPESIHKMKHKNVQLIKLDVFLRPPSKQQTTKQYKK